MERYTQPDRAALRQGFVAQEGSWDPQFDPLLALDPAFLDRYLELAQAAAGQGALTPRLRELVLLAINASVTHLRPPEIRRRMARALDLGASVPEILEVLQLTSVLGIHSCSLGVAALADEMRQAGREAASDAAPLTERQLAAKEAFNRDRGYWSPRWDSLLRLDVAFFEAYAGYSSHPWTTGTLSPKARELIYVAIDCATTHLYDPGLRVHIRNALGYGATPEEILEVLKVASLIGVQTCTVGAAELAAELAARSGG